MPFTYAIRSPDRQQQIVKDSLLKALDYLSRCPSGWYAEEFFDATLSRGVVALQGEKSDTWIRKAIVLLKLPQSQDKVIAALRHQSLKETLAKLAEIARS